MKTELRPDEDLIDVRVENKTTVGNVRAVKLRPRRIWTVDNPIGLWGSLSPIGYFPFLRRILFRGVLRSDLRCDIGPTRAFLRLCLSHCPFGFCC